MRIASHGAREALRQDAGFAEGLNTWMGKITYRAVGESQGREWTPVSGVLG
jgi:alanine dehydrogenase